jgi:hypothetical protein
VNKYCGLLTTKANKHGLIGKPADICNVVETGLQLNRVDKVVALKAVIMFMFSLQMKEEK